MQKLAKDENCDFEKLPLLLLSVPVFELFDLTKETYDVHKVINSMVRAARSDRSCGRKIRNEGEANKCFYNISTVELLFTKKRENIQATSGCLKSKVCRLL